MKNIPAFPNNFTIEKYQGLTIRDYFAAKALQGLLASEVNDSMQEFISRSYKIADAMMEERLK
jgi:hypothetical protein